MKYMIFNSEGAAINAARNILKIWSIHLNVNKGYDVDGDFILSSAIRKSDGMKVPFPSAPWDIPVQYVEGWAIKHPDAAADYGDGTPFNMDVINNFDPLELARIGVPNPNAMGQYTEVVEVTDLDVSP